MINSQRTYHTGYPLVSTVVWRSTRDAQVQVPAAAASHWHVSRSNIPRNQRNKVPGWITAQEVITGFQIPGTDLKILTFPDLIPTPAHFLPQQALWEISRRYVPNFLPDFQSKNCTSKVRTDMGNFSLKRDFFPSRLSCAPGSRGL